ncbi:MAG: flagellar motor switch protein FliM [Pseudomonadales bacterium]
MAEGTDTPDKGDNSILTQDEIDALLHTVDDDAGVGGDGTLIRLNGRDVEVRDYDLVAGDRIVRGQFPILNVINQKLSRAFRTHLGKYIFSEVNVTPSGIEISRYSDYIYTLYVPTSVHLVNMAPLNGEAMVVMDAKFIYEIVDQFFGGGRNRTKVEGREFSVSESRIINRLFEFVRESTEEAWRGTMPVRMTQSGYEVNPSLVNLGRPNDVIVVSSFEVAFDSGRGNLQIAMPYSMLEPHQELVDSAGNKKEEEDPQWTAKMERHLLDVDVALTCHIGNKQLTMAEVLKLKAGDFIPLQMPEVHPVSANGVPAFRARLGATNGNVALEFEDDRVR